MLEPILVSIALFYRALSSTLGIQAAFQGTYKYIGSMELVHHEFLNQQVNQSNNGIKEISQFNGSIKLSSLVNL